MISRDVEIETGVTDVRHEKRIVKVEIPGEFSRPAWARPGALTRRLTRAEFSGPRRH